MTAMPGSRTPLVVGAVIVLVAAIGLVVWFATRGEPGVGQPSPIPTISGTPTATPSASPTASATPSPSPPSVIGFSWEVADFPGGPLHGAGRVGDRWIALDGVQAWHSTDGTNWQSATVDETPQEAPGQLRLGRIAELGGTTYSVGQWFGPIDAVHPVVWSTQDGQAWTQVPPTRPWGYIANDVASDGQQLAVAGSFFGFGDGRVWTSPDAATWTEHTSDGGPATMNAIHGDGDGFVAVGLRTDAQGANLPAIWVSPDGQSWTDASVPPVDTSVTLLDVTRLPDGRYVALGILGADFDAGQFFAWYADDPASWTDAGVIAGGTVPGLLLATDDVLLAIIGGRDGPQVFFTTDATAWTASPVTQPDLVARVSASATDGTDVVLLGGIDEGTAHFVWIGRPTTE